MAIMQFDKAVALVLLAVLLLGVTGRTSALGTNCKGSSNCGFSSKHTLSDINTRVQTIPDPNVFNNGQHIACSGHICAFYQNIGGTRTGQQAKADIQTLIQFGCKICGSFALNGVDVNFGELTVNYVANPLIYDV